MSTFWNGQICNNEGKYYIQFETDNKELYKLVESTCQVAIDIAYPKENFKQRLTEKQSAGYDLKVLNGEYCNHYCEKQKIETCKECKIWEAIQKLGYYEDSYENIETLKKNIRLDMLSIKINDEHCMTCNNRKECVNTIINNPNTIIKCIHFVALKRLIEKVYL